MKRTCIRCFAVAIVALCATALPNSQAAELAKGGIQWFATLEPARRVAEKTGRPILFLTAAPHCGGVSGMW